MKEKYYEIELTIKAKVLVPTEEYESKEEAIESIEMSDFEDLAYAIQENKDSEIFVFANKNTVKEIEY